MHKGRSRVVAVVLVLLGAVAVPATVLGQSGETAGMITEIKTGRGKVEVRPASGAWRAATPLSALRVGDEVRATGDATAVVLLTGGRGAIRVQMANSPYTVPAGHAEDSATRKARALLTASLGFLAAEPKEQPRAVLSTRSAARPPEILTPRNGRILPDSVAFEWLGSQSSRYTVRILDPSGMVVERKGVVGARLLYPPDAPPLRAGVRYRFQVEALGHPPHEAWFEIVDAARAAAVKEALQQLEASLGTGVSAASLAAVRVGALAAEGLFHDARLVALAALRGDPDEPSLHMLMGKLYLQTGLPQLATESFDEARSLMSREGP